MSTDTPTAVTDLDVPTIDLSVSDEDGGDRQAYLTVPDSATDEEAAVLAVCLGAHLHDWQVRADINTTQAQEIESADGWTLAGRYDCRNRTDLPQVNRGEEWKMAGRTGWR